MCTAPAVISLVPEKPLLRRMRNWKIDPGRTKRTKTRILKGIKRNAIVYWRKTTNSIWHYRSNSKEEINQKEMKDLQLQATPETQVPPPVPPKATNFPSAVSIPDQLKCVQCKQSKPTRDFWWCRSCHKTLCR